MDDYSITSLTESKNEWCARLVSILTHNVITGINSIFDEANKLCIENEEENKYLMTFQNLLSTIPNWNTNTIETERKRIETASGCKYLEDLVTCVHIIQLKALTCIRVGQKQKKIDIDIPSIDKFAHQVYVNTARKLYTNIYLFEKDLFPLQIQRNNRELEILVKEAILTTIRENIPVEQILRSYMEETEELEIQQEKTENQEKTEKTEKTENQENTEQSESSSKLQNKIPIDLSQNTVLMDTKLENLAQEIKKSDAISISTEISTIKPQLVQEIPQSLKSQVNAPDNTESLSINFSNIDNVIDSIGNEQTVTAPKDLETLEKISEINNAKRKEEEDEDKLTIGADTILDLQPITLD